jgi:hypothetical protein
VSEGKRSEGQKRENREDKENIKVSMVVINDNSQVRREQLFHIYMMLAS